MPSASFDLRVYLYALALLAAIAVATWSVSLLRRNASVVDSVWSLFLLASAVCYAGFASWHGPRGWIILGLLAIWAVRLGVYITVRNWGEPEDRRYAQIRANHQPGFGLKSLFIVFLLQAALAWVISLPLHAGILGSGRLNLCDALGIALVVFGIGFESIADLQLARFKARPDSHGQVMDRGLWRYSRHPNYFGECCVWWGFWLVAAGAGAWWSVISPLLMTLLLLRISGVTLLERDIAGRRPAYRDYVASTNAFVPGPPRRRVTYNR
jgi:steroid 5-alpha reductase family enzyme